MEFLNRRVSGLCQSPGFVAGDHLLNRILTRFRRAVSRTAAGFTRAGISPALERVLNGAGCLLPGSCCQFSGTKCRSANTHRRQSLHGYGRTRPGECSGQPGGEVNQYCRADTGKADLCA